MSVVSGRMAHRDRGHLQARGVAESGRERVPRALGPHGSIPARSQARRIACRNPFGNRPGRGVGGPASLGPSARSGSEDRRVGRSGRSQGSRTASAAGRSGSRGAARGGRSCGGPGPRSRCRPTGRSCRSRASRPRTARAPVCQANRTIAAASGVRCGKVASTASQATGLFGVVSRPPRPGMSGSTVPIRSSTFASTSS